MTKLDPDEVVELGDAWASSSVNCAPFRRHGVLTAGPVRWCAFYDAAGDVAVLRWAPGAAAAEKVTIPCERKPHDAHRAISLGVDARGCVHLAYGAHSAGMLHTRSRGARLSEGFTDVAEFAKGRARRYTYPMFLNAGPDRELLLLCRNGDSSAGSIEVSRWNDAQQVFAGDAWPLLDGRRGGPWTASPYLNDPVVAPGGEVFLFFVWRLSPQAIGQEGVVVNRGLEMVTSKDALRSIFAFNRPLALPATPVSSVPFVSVPLGSSLINQAGAALLPNGNPAMASYWEGGNGIPQYRLVWRDGAEWRRARISKFKSRFRLQGQGTLPLPHSRPVILAGKDGTLYCLCRSREFDGRLVLFVGRAPDYNFESLKPVVLCDEDLGFYEPVVDRGAWEQGEGLLVYVQKCGQQVGDEPAAAASSTARLVRWSESRIGQVP